MIAEACVWKYIRRLGPKHVVQHCRAVLHLSFLSHLQIRAALLTESKSKSNFPSWKWFSIDPHPELIGFMSCLCRNQIMAENICEPVCVWYCVAMCLNRVCMCVCAHGCVYTYVRLASFNEETSEPQDDHRPVIWCSCHLWSRSRDAMCSTNKILVHYSHCQCHYGVVHSPVYATLEAQLVF